MNRSTSEMHEKEVQLKGCSNKTVKKKKKKWSSRDSVDKVVAV